MDLLIYLLRRLRELRPLRLRLPFVRPFVRPCLCLCPFLPFFLRVLVDNLFCSRRLLAKLALRPYL